MSSTPSPGRRARELLDWTPQTSTETGFGQLLDWYEANRSWASQISTA